MGWIEDRPASAGSHASGQGTAIAPQSLAAPAPPRRSSATGAAMTEDDLLRRLKSLAQEHRELVVASTDVATDSQRLRAEAQELRHSLGLAIRSSARLCAEAAAAAAAYA